MSNKLKTLSPQQLEHLIEEKVGAYLQENCTCVVSNVDTPNIDSEADTALNDERKMMFEVTLSYIESD